MGCCGNKDAGAAVANRGAATVDGKSQQAQAAAKAAQTEAKKQAKEAVPYATPGTETGLIGAWGNHFSAFAAKDVDKILLDYNESSVVKVYTQETGDLQTYTGVAGVKKLFTGLFEKLKDATDVKPACDPIVESVQNWGQFGHVFLQWSAPSAGIDYACDTFIFDPKTHKILRQDVVINDFKASVATPADSVVKAEGKVQEAWDNHFAAFGEKNVDKIMADYQSGASQLNMHTQGSGKVTQMPYNAIKFFFKKLFHNLKDRKELVAPVIHCEVLPGDLGHVFLIWRSPTDGYKYVTDSFILGKEGRIIRQNICALKTSDDQSPPASPKADGK